MNTRPALSILLGSLISACGGTGKEPVVPTGPTVADRASNEGFRATQPSPTEPRAFQLPSVQQFNIGKAFEVYLVERHTLPTISLSVRFEGGTMRDSKGKEGMASVCSAMLTEGTQALDKLAYREKMADMGSSVSSSASLDGVLLSMSTLSRNFEGTMELFKGTMTTPAFRNAELKRLVSRRLESLKQAKAAPGSIARRLSSRVGMGAAHPIGKITTEKSLKSIRRKDCVKFHKAYVNGARAQVFAVGDITKEVLTRALEANFPGWAGRTNAYRGLPKASPAAARVYFVDVPKVAQSMVTVVHGGPLRTDKQYFATSMMSRILGGGFASRLNMNLREKNGYAYGAGGGFSYWRDLGRFSAGASVRSDATLQSLREIYNEVTDMHAGKRPATAEELAREQSGAILSMPSKFATGRGSLGQYRSLVYYGLPLSYYNAYVDNIRQVKLEQVNAAAAAFLEPQELKILVVGDANGEVNVSGADGKDTRLVDKDGKPVVLLDAIKQALANGDFGGGELVMLDPDGNTK